MGAVHRTAPLHPDQNGAPGGQRSHLDIRRHRQSVMRGRNAHRRPANRGITHRIVIHAFAGLKTVSPTL
jgi:hypothetical protein